MTVILRLDRRRGIRQGERAWWLALSALLAARAAAPCGFRAGSPPGELPRRAGVESGAAVDRSVRPRQAV